VQEGHQVRLLSLRKPERPDVAASASARSAPEVMALRAEARRRPRTERRRMLARLAAAVVVIAAVGGAGLWVGMESGFAQSRSLNDQTFRTGLGERATFTLPDGSVVTLNTATVLRTREDTGKRLLYLDEGQAFFRVAKDRRHPFIVAAAGRTVTAVGTAFDVRVDGEKLEVTLVEGKVKVDAPTPEPAADLSRAARTQSTEVVAGNRLVASIETPSLTVAPADTVRETSWLSGWLDFDNEPLGQVAEEFNRYSPRKIVVADARLAQTPVSGRFEADDAEAFTRGLAKYRIARVESTGPDVIRLGPP